MAQNQDNQSQKLLLGWPAVTQQRAPVMQPRMLSSLHLYPMGDSSWNKLGRGFVVSMPIRMTAGMNP